MAASPVRFTVFTKPWKTKPLPELARFVKGLGFDGIELPVRPGFQVEPARIARDLPQAARTLAAEGVTITSVAGSTDEPTIAACAEAGIRIIRVCLDVPPGMAYLDYEARVQREYDRLLPLLDRYGVTIGVQNHSGRYIANAMGLRHLIERYTPAQVGAVLDPAHCALNGEIPELALDIVWSHLCMVNLKNAYWHRVNGPEADVAHYERRWTSGSQGLLSWPTVAAELRRRKWTGPICLTAEYTAEDAVDRLIARDIAFVRSLLSE